MTDLIEMLAKNIVDDPKSVKTSLESIEGRQVVKLIVNQGDMGKIIGKGGKVIRAIRNLLRIRAASENKRVYLELVNQDQNA